LKNAKSINIDEAADSNPRVVKQTLLDSAVAKVHGMAHGNHQGSNKQTKTAEEISIFSPQGLMKF